MKEKVVIPESQNEIPLYKLQEYTKGFVEGNDEHNKILAFKVFLGIDVKMFDKMRVTDIDSIWLLLSNCLNQEQELQQRFKHDGIEYGLIPDLNNISWGEYIDAEAYFSESKNYHKLLAVLYRPIKNVKGDYYDIEPYNGTGERAEIFKNLPMAIYTGVAVFFYRLSKALLETTLQSLKKEEKKHSTREGYTQRNGGGIRISTT